MRNLLGRALACAALFASPAAAQTVIFSEGFENGLSNWTATGLWHDESLMDICGSQLAPFPDGVHCAYYGIQGQCNYDTGTTNSGTLTLNAPIALPAFGPAASLHCWTRHETEACAPGNLYDVFDIQVSTNGGASWIYVGRRCNAKVEAANVWSPRGIDLSAYLGQSILLRFVFDTTDDFDNAHLGALVDHIEVRLEAGQPFCTSACPCAGPFNNAPIGYGMMSGCTNSAQLQGELAGGGTPSVSADSVVLHATNMNSRSVALFLQSDGQNNGAFNGDGRFCLTGAPLKLGVRLAPLGAASLPGPADPPLSVLGGVPAAGATRFYQVTYRDPTSWCTSATLNHTDGYRITWTP